jgi:hypothetical protein
MSPTLTAEIKRDRVRSQIGRKTAAEIRTWVEAGAPETQDDRDWAFTIADRLELTGFLTLADVTDEEFDQIIA